MQGQSSSPCICPFNHPPQVVFPFGGRVHEVLLPPWQELDASKAKLALEAEAAIVLQCLTCERAAHARKDENSSLTLLYMYSLHVPEP